MSSENARQAALQVKKRIKTGKKIVMGEILDKLGYAPNTVANPNNVTNTATFQKEMKTIIEEMTTLRDKIILEMNSKDISKERLSDLSNTLKNTIHDIQLLSGEPTDITKNKEYEVLAQEIRSLIEEVKK